MSEKSVAPNGESSKIPNNETLNKLSVEDATRLVESMSFESQKKIFEALVRGGVVNRCHWRCNLKQHEGL